MEQAPVRPPAIPGLNFKVGLTLVVAVLLAVFFLAYLMYARGWFERSVSFTLTTANAEGVTPGMPVTFSGMPIGQAKDIQLAGNGDVLVRITLPLKNTVWVRKTSVFTLDKPIVGNAKIRVSTPDMSGEPLEDGALRPLVSSDATKEIPGLVTKVQGILDNVQQLTRDGGEIKTVLADVQTVTGRMAGEGGVLAGVLGSDDKAQVVMQALERTNKLVADLEGVSLKVDDLLTKADSQVFGQGGVMDNSNEAIRKVQLMLDDVRAGLAQVNATLDQVKAIAGNVEGATDDLELLRAEVDEAVRRTNRLIADIQAKWPFSRKSEIKLP
jgi:phospholipid/cholesterol/gamma-HCH transport system substrate-binding protein